MKLIKNAFIIFILSIFIAINEVYAESWIPVQSESNKYVELDIDSIKKDGKTIQYCVRRYNGNDVIIDKFSTNFNNNKTTLINKSVYNANDYAREKHIFLSTEEAYTNQEQISPIKSDNLKNALYNFLKLVADTPTLDSDIDWQEYFNKQQKKMQKYWHPNLIYYWYYPDERAVIDITMVINKNGDIVYRCSTFKNNSDEHAKNFNKRLMQQIDNVFRNVPKFEPLPKEYKGDKIVLVMRFEFSLKQDTSIRGIYFDDRGFGDLLMGKNISVPIFLGQVLLLPIKIPYSLLFE